MTELEQKVVARFRELGSKKLRGVEAWEQAEIVVGDSISYESVRPKGEDKHRRVFTLTVEGALRVQALGIETFLGSVIVDTELVANRKQDGAPIHILRGFGLKRSVMELTLAGLRLVSMDVRPIAYLVVQASDGMMIFSRALFRMDFADLPRSLKTLRRERRLYERNFSPFRLEGMVLSEAKPWLVDGGLNGSGHCIGRSFEIELLDPNGRRSVSESRIRPAMHLYWTTSEGLERSVEVIKSQDGTLFAGANGAEVHLHEKKVEELKEADVPLFEDDPYAGLLGL